MNINIHDYIHVGDLELLGLAISVLSLPRSRMCWDTFLGPNANNHCVMETPFG